jgi:hypothetical protein
MRLGVALIRCELQGGSVFAYGARRGSHAATEIDVNYAPAVRIFVRGQLLPGSFD